jgi:hypothetical protein
MPSSGAWGNASMFLVVSLLWCLSSRRWGPRFLCTGGGGGGGGVGGLCRGGDLIVWSIWSPLVRWVGSCGGVYVGCVMSSGGNLRVSSSVLCLRRPCGGCSGGISVV